MKTDEITRKDDLFRTHENSLVLWYFGPCTAPVCSASVENNVAKKRHTPTKAERQLQAEWERIQSRWAKVTPFAGKYSSPPLAVTTTKRASPPTQVQEKLPSRVTPGGSTAKKESPKYTGTKMIGIATLHKSCEVPVFQQEDAIAISRMRRG